jgi:hypothetical protein
MYPVSRTDSVTSSRPPSPIRTAPSWLNAAIASIQPIVAGMKAR